MHSSEPRLTRAALPKDCLAKVHFVVGELICQIYFQREGKQTTNLASINLTKLNAFPVPLPPATEQHRIVAEVERRFSMADESEAQVEASLTRAIRLKQAVLSAAFQPRQDKQ